MSFSTDDWPKNVAILGVGLLGGSVGMSIKRARPRTEVIGFSRTQEKRDLAVSTGAVDRCARTVEDTCAGADVIVVACTVDHIADLAIQAAASSPEHCLITDVGSTKETIVTDVEKDSLAKSKFVAAHPIAGSEKTGSGNARADLFDNKTIVLTPSESTATKRTQQAESFWRLTNGQIVVLSPSQHDTYLASVSHVPHLLSALICRLMPSEAKSLVGSGWRDMTRVAAGDPAMWAAICKENRQAICSQLSAAADELSSLCELLQQHDDHGLLEWLQTAKDIKDNVSE